MGCAVHVDVRPLGDAAVIATVGDRVDAATAHRARCLQARLRASLSSALSDVVAAYASVVVRFDPAVVGLAQVIAAVRGAAASGADACGQAGALVAVRVSFGGDDGPDLDSAATRLGMPADRLVDAFCAAAYEVAFLGFLAGFPYLLGLPQALHLPRHRTPRTRVRAGSVGIAADQCGIYPRESPGGWQILGRTDAVVFDPTRQPAALLNAGDSVRFVPARAPW